MLILLWLWISVTVTGLLVVGTLCYKLGFRDGKESVYNEMRYARTRKIWVEKNRVR